MYEGLINDLAISLLRWILGVTLGCSIGFILGLLSLRDKFGVQVKWISDFGRAIPIIGLVPLVQFFLGISEAGKIGLIAWSVMFPVWITVNAGVRTRFTELELIAAAHQFSKSKFFRCYTLPRIISGLYYGIEIAIGLGWLAVVAAELIGVYSKGFWGGGMGHRLFYSFSINNWKEGILILILFGIMGFVTSSLWKTLGRRLFQKAFGVNPKELKL